MTHAFAPAWLGLVLAAVAARAELQFDVFVGYGSGGGGDGVVREGGWFPVACEVYNDGPGFEAVFELSSHQLGGGQVRRLAVELPTNTRKRFSFPMFAGARYTSWDARLLDAKGRVQARREELRPREVAWETYLLGGLAGSVGGLPAFPTPAHNRTDQHPTVARLTVEQFPDNPIALESLNALYLNSARAPELNVRQARALVAWVLGGGHLIVAPDQLTDVTGTPWLAELLPVDWGELTPVRAGAELHHWLTGGGSAAVTGQPEGGLRPAPAASPARPGRPRPSAPAVNPYARIEPDPTFAAAEMPVFRVRPRTGTVLLGSAEAPLVVSLPQGRGRVTLLTFNPEREPFRSWSRRNWFWARLCGISAEWLADSARTQYGGLSLDAVYGAMIETRQVRKLPVEWLLVLLVVYLGVIGPFDRWFLKRINRQMLTWITFPAYVACFSLLIYYLGYRLRAGETEWNELHVVDVLPRADHALLRGRTYASLYSPANTRYRLVSEQPSAVLRGEFLGPAAGGQESSRIEAQLLPAGFEARVAVPVWSSLLYVNDWQEALPPPLAARWERDAAGRPELVVQNLLPRPLPQVWVVWAQDILELGELPAGAARRITANTPPRRPLADGVNALVGPMMQAAQRRQRAFGSTDSQFLEPTAETLLAASLVGLATPQAGVPAVGTRTFVYPSGLEQSEVWDAHRTLVFARDPGHAPQGTSLPRFKVPRTSRLTWWRLAVPAAAQGG